MKAFVFCLVLHWLALQQRAATALTLQGHDWSTPSEDQAPWPEAGTGSSGRLMASTSHNTAVYVATGGFTGFKFALLSRLARSIPYPMVVGYDGRNSTIIPPMAKEMVQMALAVNNHGHVIVPASFVALQQKYGDKIENYLGYFRANPAKLAVMDWFSTSPYTYLWHLEDDVWAPSFSEIAAEWARDPADLIIKAASELPFWADKENSTWRQGAREKLPSGSFQHCNPAVFRMSKRFAQSVLQTILESEATNHHELWFPYVVQKEELSWRNLTHAEHVRMNVHLGAKRMCLNDVKEDLSIMMAHPIKCA